jgi:hypothetical protein
LAPRARPTNRQFLYGDVDKINTFFPRSGFLPRFNFPGLHPPRGQARLHRRAAAEGAGRDCAGGFRGVQTRVGDVIGWRNLFWAFTESMARDPKPWIGDTLIPKLEYALTYRMFMIEGYPRMKEIIEQDVASGLIDLPSSALDFQEPAGAAVSGQVRPRIGRPARGRPCERREGAAGFGRFGVWRPPRALRANYSGNHENVATECANVSPACPRPAARRPRAWRPWSMAWANAPPSRARSMHAGHQSLLQHELADQDLPAVTPGLRHGTRAARCDTRRAVRRS